MRRSLSDFAPLLPGDEGLPEILEEIRGELSVGVAWRELGTGKVIGCLALDRPTGLSGEPLGGGEGCLSALRLFYGQRLAGSRLKARYRNELVQDLIFSRNICSSPQWT